MDNLRRRPRLRCRILHHRSLRSADIETLGRIAGRIAGKDPDALVTIKFGEVVAFDDVAWRYPDFLARAAAVYRFLEADQLME